MPENRDAAHITIRQMEAQRSADGQAVNALNGRIDVVSKDLAATQQSLHTAQGSLSGCVDEVEPPSSGVWLALGHLWQADQSG